MKKTQAAAAADPTREPKLADLLDYGRSADVLAEVESIFRFWFPKKAFSPVASAFALTGRLFEGRLPGYRACNTEYHDYCHSLAVLSTTARLLDGALLTGLVIPEEDAVDVLIAALLHDAGYIQEEGDSQGTGAKHTRTHVGRSAAFVSAESRTFGFSRERAERIGRLILGTDMSSPWDDQPFVDRAERLVAAILAAADLLGQMADRAYLEKLLFLYYEFREAGIEGYSTAFDILKKTAGFFASVEARLAGPLGEATILARPHFKGRHGIDRDLYQEAISRQMTFLDAIIVDDKANFRHKLKRMDLEAVEKGRAS